MQWITVSTPPYESVDQFDRVLAEVGEEPEGLVARYVGMGDGKPRVVALWESKAHADRFLTERLGPALATVFGPEPEGAAEVMGIEVFRSYARDAVAS